MPSRRDKIQMTPEEIRAFIATQRTLIIVSNGVHGYPHPMPMNFYVDDDNRFYVTTFRKSQKVLNYTRDQKAALLIEAGENYHELRGVVIYATAEIIDDAATTLRVMALLRERAARVDAGEAPPAPENFATTTAEKRVAIRFTPERFISWDHGKLQGRY